MRRGFIYSIALFSLMLVGCAKPYVETNAADYATLKLVAQADNLMFEDYVTAELHDYSKGCSDMVGLGYVYTKTNEESKAYKIAAETPLMVKVSFTPSVSGGTTVIHTTDFVLKPQKNKNYVVEYLQKDKSGNRVDDFYVYMMDEKGASEIPNERIRNFNYRECM